MEEKRNNALAITGFVLSLVSLLINPVAIISILGLIFSGIGLSKVKVTNSGKGLAIAGIIISILSTIYSIWAIFYLADILSDYASYLN